MEAIGEKVEAGTFVLNFSIGSIRTKAGVKRERVEKMAEALRAPEPETVAEFADASDDIHVTKELLRVPEIKALMQETVGIRALLRSKALPVRFLKGGLYLYPYPRVTWAEGQVAAAQERIDALLDKLDGEWNAILKADEARLAPLGLFDPRDYPTLATIREKTRARYSWLRFGVPGELKSISQTAFEAERKKAQEMWAEMGEQVRLAYRESLLEFVEQIKGALTPNEDGKRRVLRQSTIDNLTTFLNDFRLQDVTDDKELAALVDRAKAAMRGVDAEVLRTEDRASDRVATTLKEIGAALGPLVVAQQRLVKLRD